VLHRAEFNANSFLNCADFGCFTFSAHKILMKTVSELSDLICVYFTSSNMAVKTYPKKFVVFSGFSVNEFGRKSYLERINLLKERFVGKRRVFRVCLRRGYRAKRMLISLVGAEELPPDYDSPPKRKKFAAGS
jgi:hypothetical protein